MRLQITFLILALSWITACVSVQNVNRPTNYAYHYDPTARGIKPKFRLVNQNENRVRLYLKVNTKQLRFSKANPDTEMRAELAVSYLTVPSFENRTVIDSSSTVLKIKYNRQQNELVTYFDINPDVSEKFIIYIKLKDKYSGRESKHFLRGMNTKEDHGGRYLMKHLSGKPVFKPFVNIFDTLLISKPSEASKKIFVKYFSKNFSPAYAPFDSDKIIRESMKPDEIYNLPVKNRQAFFVPRKKGLYHLQTDTAAGGGKIFFVGDWSFPAFRKAEDLLKPLIYITETKEYKQIVNAENKKLEIDKFWLNSAGNKEKARQLISVWYKRAQYANRYFTSYKEGWKTDRGMIYILFGPPDMLNYNEEGEKWTYPADEGANKVFQFIRENPNISQTDYRLKRNIKYTNSWYKAVDSWRNGEIYQ